MITTALSGLGFGLGLLVPIGAQNAYVLRQGLRREHVGAVVAICVLGDVVLISVGAAGVGSTIARRPAVLAAATVLGAAVLLWYAASAVRRALRSQALTADDSGAAVPLGPVLLTGVAVTWLNPHVYMDTVVLLGSVSAGYAAPWVFAAGAMAASVLWFGGLGFGARVLRPLFARPAAWRVFDLTVAAVMTAVAAGLLAGLRG